MLSGVFDLFLTVLFCFFFAVLSGGVAYSALSWSTMGRLLWESGYLFFGGDRGSPGFVTFTFKFKSAENHRFAFRAQPPPSGEGKYDIQHAIDEEIVRESASHIVLDGWNPAKYAFEMKSGELSRQVAVKITLHTVGTRVFEVALVQGEQEAIRENFAFPQASLMAGHSCRNASKIRRWAVARCPQSAVGVGCPITCPAGMRLVGGMLLCWRSTADSSLSWMLRGAEPACVPLLDVVAHNSSSAILSWPPLGVDGLVDSILVFGRKAGGVQSLLLTLPHTAVSAVLEELLPGYALWIEVQLTNEAHERSSEVLFDPDSTCVCVPRYDSSMTHSSFAPRQLLYVFPSALCFIIIRPANVCCPSQHLTTVATASGVQPRLTAWIRRGYQKHLPGYDRE